MPNKYVVRHKITAELFGVYDSQKQFRLCLPVYGLGGTGYFEDVKNNSGIDEIVIMGEPYVGFPMVDSLLGGESYSLVVIDNGVFKMLGRYSKKKSVDEAIVFSKANGWEVSHIILWTHDASGRIINMQRINIMEVKIV